MTYAPWVSDRDRTRDPLGRLKRVTPAGVSFGDAGHREHGSIVHRLARLDRERDADQVAVAFLVVGAGIGLVAGVRDVARARPLSLFSIVTSSAALVAYLVARAGFHPAATLLRRLGFRSEREIESDRQMLLVALEDSAREHGVIPDGLR